MKTITKTRAPKRRQKVALGMSGGVDSSVCAHLLIEQGYEVTGVFLECWRAPGCRSEEDRKDALKVALELEIPFQVLDFKKTYKDKVVENFFAEYAAGRTPNPDVLCNQEIKFGLFYDWAMAEGFDFIATGHYAKIEQQEEKGTTKHQLVIPADSHKDQTYFLYLLNEDHLAHTIFPLADLTKQEVRQLAADKNIHVAKKKDSVGICFIGDINVHEFLKERLGENPGEVVDTDGNVIGSHLGLWFYTIGQRHGFKINNNTLIKQSDGSEITKANIPPFYVIKKNPEQNKLVVGFGSDTLTKNFRVEEPHWINNEPKTPASGLEVQVRIRHTGELMAGKLLNSFSNEEVIMKQNDNDEGAYTWTVKLSRPTTGVAAGQSAVFYEESTDDLICLGGAVISE
jgi:tRNA-uridine 2-sulfurtransferase